MARKKRQYLQPEQAQEPVSAMLPSVWETAIYARLSVENSKKNDDGDSIEGQIEICRDYVSEHPYLHLADTYVDNGWTGTNTNRPEFQRLLSDIREGKIKALVIKDFSRFSRDYIEAGNLLENIFPAMGVRFISVVDRYDSFETDGSASSLLIPLKNLINSFYSRDQSKKVSLAVHAKQLAGEHIPSMIPYGYRKSTTQEYRFEPDPETAPIVKRIYAQFLSGTGARPIMRQLNEEGMILDFNEFTTTYSNAGSKFQNGDTLLARITPCLENGKTAFVSGIESSEGAVGSTEYIVMREKEINPYMVYLLARTEDFRQAAINSMTGSDGRQRAQVDKLKTLPYLKPTIQVIELFARCVEPMFIQIQTKNRQNMELKQARDRLLPKLMSGEIEV